MTGPAIVKPLALRYPSYHDIDRAERALRDAQEAYLRRWGWENTSSTPGSLWMWRRDFADVDARRLAWFDTRPHLRASHRPYGVITADTATAIRMTMAALEPEPDEDGDCRGEERD